MTVRHEASNINHRDPAAREVQPRVRDPGGCHGLVADTPHLTSLGSVQGADAAIGHGCEERERLPQICDAIRRRTGGREMKG